MEMHIKAVPLLNIYNRPANFFKPKNQIELPGVSVITCTNRPDSLSRITDNYCRQNHKPRELIIILNNNTMDLAKWQAAVESFPDIRVYQLDETTSLGQCMNYAIENSSFNYVAKFDDDDYYAPSYLKRQMAAFTYTNADIVGKCTRYIFFSARKILAIDNPGQENKYVKFVCGPTMVINKKVFKAVKFQNITLGEDTEFLKDCQQAGFKIYATDRFDFVYLRNSKQGSHTWEIDEDRYLRSCLIMGHTSDYITLITRLS